MVQLSNTHRPLPLREPLVLDSLDLDEVVSAASATQHPLEAELERKNPSPLRFRFHHVPTGSLGLTHAARDYAGCYRVSAPATCKECSRAIAAAVATDNWIEIGTLNQTPATAKSKAAYYHSTETTVELYQRSYRAVVIHSSAHDKRRHKRIYRILQKDRKQLEQNCKQATPNPYFCRKDAQAAGDKLVRKANAGLHRLETSFEKVPKYGRGRPAKGKPRPVIRYEYVLKTSIVQAVEKVNPLRQEADCFVLLTNLQGQ